MRKLHSYSHRKRLAILLVLLMTVLSFTGSKLAKQDKHDQAAAIQETGQSATTDPIKLYVSVLDKKEEFVSTLNYYDFEVYCNKVPQQVSYFSKKDEPIGVVFLVDMSGSMRALMSLPSSLRPIGLAEHWWKGAYQKFLAAIPHFIENSHQMNEYSIVLFNQQSWLALEWTRDRKEIENSLNSLSVTKPIGQTSLYDSIIIAIEQVKGSSNSKKAIILLSDGVDNTSKTEVSKLNAALLENNIPIYSIALNPELFSLKNHFAGGTDLIKKRAEQFFIDLTSMTGGTAFFPLNKDGLINCFEKIGEELRHQYIVGFTPNCKHKNNKPHRIQVKLAQQAALAADGKKISIRHREEYKPGLSLNKK